LTGVGDLGGAIASYGQFGLSLLDQIESMLGQSNTGTGAACRLR
jgi:hypothetical protein